MNVIKMYMVVGRCNIPHSNSLILVHLNHFIPLCSKWCLWFAGVNDMVFEVISWELCEFFILKCLKASIVDFSKRLVIRGRIGIQTNPLDPKYDFDLIVKNSKAFIEKTILYTWLWKIEYKCWFL